MMRIQSLAQEFEDLVEAFRLGTPKVLYEEAQNLRTRVTRHDVELSCTPRELDQLSYEIGALEAAADLLATTAGRAEQTSILDGLRHRQSDLRVLHQLGLWAVEDVQRDGNVEHAAKRSQKALAEATKVSPASLSRAILKRLREAGFVAEPRRASIVHAEITAAGMAALDQVLPGWRADRPTALEEPVFHREVPRIDIVQESLYGSGLILPLPQQSSKISLHQWSAPAAKGFPLYDSLLQPEIAYEDILPLNDLLPSSNPEISVRHAYDEYAVMLEQLSASLEAALPLTEQHKPKRPPSSSLVGHWLAQQASSETLDKQDKEAQRV